jgi:hypothetical protein
VALAVAAAERSLLVYHGHTAIKQLAVERLAWRDPGLRPLCGAHATRSSCRSPTSPSSVGSLNGPEGSSRSRCG